MHVSTRTALIGQAQAIYQTWRDHHFSTAEAMLNLVPHHRTAYVVMFMTQAAIEEGLWHEFISFISSVTK